jgi:hypothetical protein
MGLKEGVLRGIYGHGFVKPSPIQQKGILPVIQGKDTIAQVTYLIFLIMVNRLNQVPAKQVALPFQFCQSLTHPQFTLRL